MGAMVPPSRNSCYNFRVVEVNKVVDGDTIDVTIDLGFGIYKKDFEGFLSSRIRTHLINSQLEVSLGAPIINNFDTAEYYTNSFFLNIKTKVATERCPVDKW